jgi:hypothetical protein
MSVDGRILGAGRGCEEQHVVEGPRPFAHLNAPNAGLYRAVMAAFVRAKRRFAVHLRPEDVHEALVWRNGSAPELAEINGGTCGPTRTPAG